MDRDVARRPRGPQPVSPLARTILASLVPVAATLAAIRSLPGVLVLAPAGTMLSVLAAAIAWRTRRPNIAAWATGKAAGFLAGIGLLASGAVVLATRGDWRQGALATLAWAAGLAAATWRGAVVRETPGRHLFRLIREKRRSPTGSCPVPNCPEPPLSCDRNGCARVLCGTHWIMAEARCAECGHDGLLARPNAGRRHPAWTAAPLILALAGGIALLMTSSLLRGT